MKRISISFIFALLCIISVDAQKRYIVIDMETCVPQREVRIRWDKKHETHSIWDGSFYMDDVRDSVEIFKPGYMTRIMKPQELTDTIGILPTFDKLGEVVVIGKYKPRKFGWTLKPITKEEIAMMYCDKQGINLDIIGGIKKLLTRKKRNRQKRVKEKIAEY